jgi:undecaprenyl-diphosphatase
LVGLGFLVSAAFLLASGVVSGARGEVTSWMAMAIGLAQGVAVLPGISRSGVTIATGMLFGLRGSEAFRFSFLISLPAITGAAVLEAIGTDHMGSLAGVAWLGGAIAMVTGYVALVILQRIILIGRMWMFALYLVPLGLFLLAR